MTALKLYIAIIIDKKFQMCWSNGRNAEPHKMEIVWATWFETPYIKYYTNDKHRGFDNYHFRVAKRVSGGYFTKSIYSRSDVTFRYK